jgi:hypothetical protein
MKGLGDNEVKNTELVSFQLLADVGKSINLYFSK